MEHKIVYRILNRNTNEVQGVYTRAYHDHFEFESLSEALNSNCHGIYKNTKKYKIAKYRVMYELIDDDAGREL